MASVVHLDDVQSVELSKTIMDFIHSLEKIKLPKGTFFSGTVGFSDLPDHMRQAEIQGVIGYISGDILIDMTLTSVDIPKRWTCTFRTGKSKAQWIERK